MVTSPVKKSHLGMALRLIEKNSPNLQEAGDRSSLKGR